MVLLSGIFRAALMPKEINNYENRYAAQLPALSAESFSDGSYQSDFESALSDQFPMSQYFKKAWNDASSRYLTALLPSLTEEADLVAYYNGMHIYRGYMLYRMKPLEGAVLEQYDIVTDSYNRAISANPDTEFYFYYIESDTTLDFATGEKVPAYEYLQSRLCVPEGNVGRLCIDSFDDYSNFFYRTDHHWNNKGSYQGYLGICSLMMPEDTPLPIAEESKAIARYVGTKAISCRMTEMYEDVDAYFFDYPDYGCTYGDEDAFRRGADVGFSYGGFYGGDYGETIFDTGRPELKNILVLGDSYDNAILKLLASHYNRTCSVDLRNYTGGVFNITDYINANDISVVLVVGSSFLFGDATFAVES